MGGQPCWDAVVVGPSSARDEWMGDGSCEDGCVGGKRLFEQDMCVKGSLDRGAWAIGGASHE